MGWSCSLAASNTLKAWTSRAIKRRVQKSKTRLGLKYKCRDCGRTLFFVGIREAILGANGVSGVVPNCACSGLLVFVSTCAAPAATRST